MSNLPQLQGSKLLLRKPKKDNINARILFGSPIEFVKMSGGDTKKINEFTLEDAPQWYNKILEHPCKWVIEYDGACIDEIGLTPYKQDNKARYSIAIFDMSKLDLGIGTEVSKMVLDRRNTAIRRVNLDRDGVTTPIFNSQSNKGRYTNLSSDAPYAPTSYGDV